MKTRQMLTLEDCKKISAAAEAEAKKNNWNVCIAILDDGGHLLHLVRMDGATPANSRIAVAKGVTSADTRRFHRDVEERKGRAHFLARTQRHARAGRIALVAKASASAAVGASRAAVARDERSRPP